MTDRKDKFDRWNNDNAYIKYGKDEFDSEWDQYLRYNSEDYSEDELYDEVSKLSKEGFLF